MRHNHQVLFIPIWYNITQAVNNRQGVCIGLILASWYASPSSSKRLLFYHDVQLQIPQNQVSSYELYDSSIIRCVIFTLSKDAHFQLSYSSI